MIIFNQILQNGKFSEMRWMCDGLTDIIDKIFKYNNLKSYISVYHIDKDFRTNRADQRITFIVKFPTVIIGFITCNGYGTIIDTKLNIKNISNNKYEDISNKFKELMDEKIHITELQKIEFVNNNLNNNYSCDMKIIWFIANFVFHQHNNNSNECIINQFRMGYCLHFAMILKDLFKDGEICWCAPFGHMVYMHKGIAYDIEGVCISDCDYYIPISYIKDGLKDFTRVTGDMFNASVEYIQDAIEKYKNDNNIK